MDSEEERIQILELISSGQISAQQGVELLRALSAENEEDLDEHDQEYTVTQEPEQPVSEVRDRFAATQPPEIWVAENQDSVHQQLELANEEEPEILDSLASAPYPPQTPQGVKRWQRWWWIPLWIGVAGIIFGGLLMFWAFQATGLSFWFACSWFPFLVGLALMVLAWSSRAMRWLHLRIQQAPGERPQNIAISIPLPLGLAAWLLRMVRPWVPEQFSHLDAAFLTLKETSSDTPFYLEVDDGADGERVEIYIG